MIRKLKGRFQYAAKTTGAWFKPLLSRLTQEVANIDIALEELGFVPQDDNVLPYPEFDERWERLLLLIKKQLRNGNNWVQENRLVIFTEYKTTLDYLERRLKETFNKEPQAIRVLFGGMSDPQREEIKQAFNDPDHPVRILVATDAASEGLNLQETAHLILHYDIPWNPARLDQRNGRLDRHGQARDVIVFHFTSEDDADLKFLGHVVGKVNTIREELGSMGEVFDAAFQRKFTDLLDTNLVVRSLDEAVEKRKGRTQIPRAEIETGNDEVLALQKFEQEIDLTPETLKSTLEIALGLGVGLPRFEEPDNQGRLRLRSPIPQQWQALIDDHLRLEADKGQRGALPALVFDSKHFIQTRNGRLIYRPTKDTVLLHLGHPIFHQALAMFARARFPGGMDNWAVSRWTVRYGNIPAGNDGLLLLTVEELAVNELREPFHHWIRTVRFPVTGGKLGEVLAHIPAGVDHPSQIQPNQTAINQAQDLWDEISVDVKDKISQMAKELTEEMSSELKLNKETALKQEKERFKSRIKEVEKAMGDTTLKKLEKDRDRIINDMRQLNVFSEDDRKQEEELQNLEEELQRRRNRYGELLKQLESEQTRIINNTLPKRYSLRGKVQVFPVTVEIRLPEVMQ